MINPITKSAEMIIKVGEDVQTIAKYWEEKKTTTGQNWQVIESLKLQLKELGNQNKRLQKAVAALENHALADEKPKNQETPPSQTHTAVPGNHETVSLE